MFNWIRRDCPLGDNSKHSLTEDTDGMATLLAAPRIRAPEVVYRGHGLQDDHYRNQRTRNQFRPRTTGKGGATSYQLRQYAEATLGGGSLRKVVKLPEGEDENEWLAVNSECLGPRLRA